MYGESRVKEPMVVSKALVLSSSTVLGLGGKRTKQNYNYLFIFRLQIVKGRMLLSSVIGRGGKVCSQKHFGKILVDGKIFASHCKCKSVQEIRPWG